MVGVVAFSHIAIRVSDLDNALACYRNTFGFRDRSLLVVTDTPSFREAGLDDAEMVAHFLHRDATVIELQVVRSRAGHPLPPQFNHLGYHHLAFRVDGVEATAVAMAAAGGEVDWATLTANDGVGGSAIFGADPDGQRLELLQLRDGPQQPVGDALVDQGPCGDGTVTAFAHVVLGVRDLERAERFYTSGLGATVESREPAATMLRVFDTLLLLQQATPETPVLGIRALAFCGASAANLADPDGASLDVTAFDAVAPGEAAAPDQVAVEQITARVLAYGRFVAQGDLEGIADLFVHGAVSGDAHPDPVAGRAAVLELYRATLAYDGTPSRLRVSTTDLKIDLDDHAGTATCMSTFTVRAPGSTDADAPLFLGRYADAFALIDGRWEFTRRHVHLDMTDEDAVRREGVNLG